MKTFGGTMTVSPASPGTSASTAAASWIKPGLFTRMALEI